MAAPLQFLITTFPLMSADTAVLYKPRVNELTAQVCIKWVILKTNITEQSRVEQSRIK
jgi:hypothetical protein